MFRYWLYSNIEICEGDIEIDDYAFYESKILKNITITSNTTSIGKLSFNGCI